MNMFHICTIANNSEQYEQMKVSFREAGFDETKCRYSCFDNSLGNIHDPYSTLKFICSNTVEPYIIFCHQDVLLNQGHGFNQLVKVIEELDKVDSNWAVAGNAGINDDYKIVAKITDPCSTLNWHGKFPQRVQSLDENFLVIKSSANITSSSKLKGFHFYGIDLCLNAILKGYSCYVVDFHLTHLSKGKLDQSFWKLRMLFKERWNREFNFCYVRAMCSTVFLSKHKALHIIFDSKAARFYISRLANSSVKDIVNIYTNPTSSRYRENLGEVEDAQPFNH